MSELKNCPFCGEKEIAITDDFYGCHVYCISCRAKTKDYGTIEEAINAWNTRADGWISVEDRLPEGNEGMLILCNVDGKVDIGWYIPVTKVFMDRWEAFENGEITHWRPLPEPPKGD